MIDDQSDPGEWARAIARGCLAGRVFVHRPRVLPLADWLCTIPGIPAGWGVDSKLHFFALSQSGAPVSQHIGVVPNLGGVAAKS